MKKRRVGRGLEAVDVPEVPNKAIFQQAFNLYYGWMAPTWRWGDLNADQTFSIIKNACTAKPPSVRDLEELKGILANLGLLM